MTSNNSFITMVRQIRGTDAVNIAVTNGMWFDVKTWYTEINGGTPAGGIPTSGMVWECQQAQLAAEAAETAAEAWAVSGSEVETGRESARTYASQAGVSASAGSDSAALAKKWATDTSDVEAGLGSAKTYAEDAQDWAIKDTAVETGKESAKTYAGLAQTAESTISPHYDAIDTIEDIYNNDNTTLTKVAAIDDEIVVVAGIDSEVKTVAGDTVAINAVYADLTDSTYSDIENAKSNADAATTAATDASGSESLAKEWASKAQGQPITGENSKYSAYSYSLDAKEFRDELTGLTATGTTVANKVDDTLGDATAVYNSTTGELALGIPGGVPGDSLTMTSIVANTGDDAGKYTWFFSDGTNFTTNDLTGVEGPQGDPLSMTSVVDSGNGTYTWNFSAGAPYTTDDLRGGEGPAGESSQSTHFIGTTASSGLPGQAGETDTYGIYNTVDQLSSAKIGEYKVYNGATGAGSGDMLKSENLMGMGDVDACCSNIGTYTKTETDAEILVAVPAQDTHTGKLLQTDGTVTSWGYDPTIGSW